MTHTEHEDDNWTINIGDHPERSDSPMYHRSRKHMIDAVKAAQPWLFGPPPYQDHHGGGVWVYPGAVSSVTVTATPQLYLLPLGIEWSAQFCADPAKVDGIRKLAEQLVEAFPMTEPWYLHTLDMTNEDLNVLHTPITDAAGVALWTDSFWNASVPLPQSYHTGMPPKAAPGYHHAPKPIVDIRAFKRDDFELFPEPGVAVVPVAEHGSGDGRVRVAWMAEDYLPPVQSATISSNEPVKALPALPTVGAILSADHPIARAAFAGQTTEEKS